MLKLIALSLFAIGADAGLVVGVAAESTAAVGVKKFFKPWRDRWSGEAAEAVGSGLELVVKIERLTPGPRSTGSIRSVGFLAKREPHHEAHLSRGGWRGYLKEFDV